MFVLIAGLLLLFILFSLRYGWWRQSVSSDHPRILMYHMVTEHRDGAKFNKLRVRPAAFDSQIGWLSENGYYFALMSELVNPDALPPKTVVLTFDDGFEDNFIHAHPVLLKYNAKATLYLVQDRFDRDWSVSKKAHHNSGELKDETKLTDAQVRQMLDSGCWELGGHTRTHVNLSRLNQAEKIQEISGSKQALEQKFDTQLSSFAYPFGIYDLLDTDIVQQAGFDTAVTTVEGIDENIMASCFELKRVKISGKDGNLAFRIRMRTGQRG
ncbi:MAG: polysaccharide deacetylase family protein [Pontibacterium sp.]